MPAALAQLCRWRGRDMADESVLQAKPGLASPGAQAGDITSGSWDWRLAFSANASSMDSRKLLSTTSKAWRWGTGKQRQVQIPLSPEAETPLTDSNKSYPAQVTTRWGFTQGTRDTAAPAEQGLTKAAPAAGTFRAASQSNQRSKRRQRGSQHRLGVRPPGGECQLCACWPVSAPHG